MVLVLKNVTLMSLCLFNDHLVRQCGRFCLLYKLMYLIVDGGMVQQVDHPLLLGFLLPLAPLTVYLRAEIQVSCCLWFVLSEVSQISVSEMPKWSWLFEALLESVPYLIHLCTIFDCLFKSVPAVICFIASCHKYEGPLPSPQEPGLPRRSPSFAAWRVSMRQPCQLLSSSSPDTSPWGSSAWFLQLDGLSGPQRKTEWELSQWQLKIVT